MEVHDRGLGGVAATPRPTVAMSLWAAGRSAFLFKTQMVLSGPLRLGLRLARGYRFKPDRYIRVLYRNL